MISILDEEQFQLITWAKDHTLRLWAIESKMIMVSLSEHFGRGCVAKHSSHLRTNRAYTRIKLSWDAQTQGQSHPWDAQN